MKEYRVLNKSKRGIFCLCGEDETRAQACLAAGGYGLNFDKGDTVQLQSRPAGTQGDDSTWSDEA